VVDGGIRRLGLIPQPRQYSLETNTSIDTVGGGLTPIADCPEPKGNDVFPILLNDLVLKMLCNLHLAEELVRAEEHEICLYERYQRYVSYGFYIAKRSD